VPSAGEELVVALDDPRATDPERVGGKAASLARAAAAGIATLPGVVLTTAFCREVDRGADPDGHPALADAYARAGGDGRDLVVRSSSVVEDTAESSMAGQFASVVGVRGGEAFARAVREVLDSRRGAGAGDQPIAVLVQPLVEPELGGVLFGADPVTGRSDRRVVTAVAGGPAPLVSGEVDGSRYVLDDAGKQIESATDGGPRVAPDRLRALAELSASVAGAFGGPQDVEWAIADDGTLWLLQSRPVTTEVRGVPSGPVYGPGPVAETFPEPLSALEHDLWVPALREAVREAVVLAGASSRREAEDSGAVVVVGGHVAMDLDLAGETPAPRGWWRRLNPIPAVARLRSAWRVGRLRAALPDLAEHLLDRVDADLESVPGLADLTSRQLVGLLHRARTGLRALHAHEILMGLLTDTGNPMTGASVALRVLVQSRVDGLSDDEIVRRSPVVLALVPPHVAPRADLPEAAAVALGPDGSAGATGAGERPAAPRTPDAGVVREALRLRVRWLHELTGRAAWELGERLAAAGVLPAPEAVRHLGLDHLDALATKRAVTVPALVASGGPEPGDPLPARFRLSDRGLPIPVEGAGEGGGTGAGGGVGRGPVTHDADDPPAGSVLVTTTLAPALGPLLPRLAGIVAETGSVLSHLAILAREGGVATVVGYAGAGEELEDGAMVEVDGDSGRVTVQESEQERTP
jgi:rifampicin phosphotransferase